MTFFAYDHARDWFERMRKRPLEEAEKTYHEEATAYFRDQRALIAQQKRYTVVITMATIVMALATAVIAVFAYLQYSQSAKTAEKYERSQAPMFQAPPPKQ